MSKQQPDHGVASRRDFLRNSLTLSAGAATVALTANSVAAAAVDEPVEEAKTTASQGYHVTPHIADYYKTAAS